MMRLPNGKYTLKFYNRRSKRGVYAPLFCCLKLERVSQVAAAKIQSKRARAHETNTSG